MTDPHYHSGQPRNQLTIGVQAEPSAKRADVQHGAAGVGDVRWRDEKSAPKTGGRKKRPQDKPKKRPQDEAKKRHDIINPVCLCGVVSEGDLKALLRAKGQVAWCSRVRVCGLLALIEYFLRHKKNGVLGISADTARDYVSKRRNNYPAGTIKEPLPLLCHVGILKLARPGVHAHVHTPAVYRLGDAYVEQFEIRVHFTPLMARKFATAESRRERRLNRNFPYREQLLRDLRGVSFAPEARPIIANGITGVGMCNLAQIVSAIDGRKHDVRVSERGQITTSIGSCPRELRPHLLLNGEPVTDCDISNANWNFLPELLADRLRHVSNQLSREKYIADGSREHERLTLLLSDGDFYRAWCKDPANDTEREEKKQILNILIHSKNDRAQQNGLYRRLKSEFPITLAIVEDIKRHDHRNLSIQLQRFTADAISAALLELQSKGIAAIPLVDALICQREYHAVVCAAIGRQIFRRAGVCASVGGTRYSPLTEIEEQALAFDETAPSDDAMTYGEWEALRAVKCVAALKLLRRYPPLFVPLALVACA